MIRRKVSFQNLSLQKSPLEFRDFLSSVCPLWLFPLEASSSSFHGSGLLIQFISKPLPSQLPSHIPKRKYLEGLCQFHRSAASSITKSKSKNRAFPRFGDSHIPELRPQHIECHFGLSWLIENEKNVISPQIVPSMGNYTNKPRQIPYWRINRLSFQKFDLFHETSKVLFLR